MHIVTVISTPIHCIGLYCILFKTPDEMKSVKWYLLVLHLWIVLFDYFLGFFTIPSILFPTGSGFPLGISKYFGVPLGIQVFVGFNIFGGMCTSITSVFENRFYTICKFPAIRYWKFLRRPWLAAHYIGFLLVMVRVLHLVPEQTEEVLKRVLGKLPCLPQSVLDSPIFVVTGPNYIFYIEAIGIPIFIFALEINIFAALMVKSLRGQLKSKKMSPKTYKMQRALFIALTIQMIFPMIVFVIPICYVIISVILLYYNQAIINLIIINVGAHGLVSTTVMITVHGPYRVTVMAWIGKSREDARKTISGRQISVTPINN